MARPSRRGTDWRPVRVGSAIVAAVELAKLHEHRLHDREEAVRATARGLALIERRRRLGRPEPAWRRTSVVGWRGCSGAVGTRRLVGRRVQSRITSARAPSRAYGLVAGRAVSDELAASAPFSRRSGASGAGFGSGHGVHPAAPVSLDRIHERLVRRRGEDRHLARLAGNDRATDPLPGTPHEDGGTVGDRFETGPFDDEGPSRSRESEVGRPSRPAAADDRRPKRPMPRAPPGTCRRRLSDRPRGPTCSIGSARRVPARRRRPRRATRPPGPGSRACSRRGGGSSPSVARLVPASTSWWLTPTRSARLSRADGRGCAAGHGLPGGQLAKHPLPADDEIRLTAHERGPRVRHLVGDRHERPGSRRSATRSGKAGTSSGTPGASQIWCRPSGVSRFSKTGALGQSEQHEVDAGVAQEVELARRRSLGVDTDDRRGPQARAGPSSAPRTSRRRPAASPAGSSGVRSRLAEPTWTISTSARGMRPPSMPESSVRGPSRILCDPIRSHQGVNVFFYELHEGDNEVYSDVLVVSESEWEPEEFFELVQSIRRRIQDGYSHDTLSEAIAVELERDHGFIFVSDDRLALRSTSRPRTRTTSSPISRSTSPTPRNDDDDDDDEEDRERRTTGRSSPTSTWAAASTRRARRRPGGPGPPRRRRDRRPRLGTSSAAEQDLDDVPVAHPVGLPSERSLPCLARLGHRAERAPGRRSATVSARMKPWARSVWMAPAASTAVDPSGIGQARTSSGPAVRNEIETRAAGTTAR